MVVINKIIAPNPGPFTGEGTNTYLIGKNDITLVDPGPAINSHIDKILKVGNGNIKRILVTHTHQDHSPAAKDLFKILKVPVYGNYADDSIEIQDSSFKNTHHLVDQDKISTKEYSIKIIHTPGHASNHFCFYVEENKFLLTGDHIMGGSTVVIAPPDGCMEDYINSLKKINKLEIKVIAPGHGDYIDNPHDLISWTINHRLKREKKVISKLKKLKQSNLEDLLKEVYDDVNVALHPIAIYSLQAHLLKLTNEKKVSYDHFKDIWSMISPESHQ